MRKINKLMFLCHGAGNGGAERVIVALANEFSKMDIDIMLVTTNAKKNDYDIDEKIDRIVIDSKSRFSIIRTLHRIKKIRELLKKRKPDCVISFSSIPNMQVLIAGFCTRIPIIVSERTDPTKYPTSALGRKIRNILYKRASRIVFQTADAQKYFSKNVVRKSSIIFNPIRDDLPIIFSGKREHIIVGIGSLSEQKDWLTGLRALELFLKDYSNYSVEIYGDGPQKDQLNLFIEKSSILKGRVYLKGFSHSAVDRLSMAEIYFSSSIYEGIPNALLEALALGIPSIQTDCPVGGPRIFIKDGFNGFLVQVGDYDSMNKRMRELADDEALRMKFSKNSILIKDELNMKKIITCWEEEIDKCLEK